MDRWRDLGKMGAGEGREQDGWKERCNDPEHNGRRRKGGDRRKRGSMKEEKEGKGRGEEGTIPVNSKSCTVCHQVIGEQCEGDNC
jgi:hypothetical protein